MQAERERERPEEALVCCALSWNPYEIGCTQGEGGGGGTEILLVISEYYQ